MVDNPLDVAVRLGASLPMDDGLQLVPVQVRIPIGKITLIWMLETLKEFEKMANAEDDAIKPHEGGERRRGLRLRRHYMQNFLHGEDREARTPDGRSYAKPDPMAPLHQSLKGVWWMAQGCPYRA